MRAPTLAATLERRILVNYRVDPDALAAVLPAPFRPLLVEGHGIGGLCLIRLGAIRPAGLAAGLGVTSENAAHRIAVQWDGSEGPLSGVYIPRRDTSSRLVALLGGRAFPGWQRRARFSVSEGDGRYRVEVSSRDGEVHIVVAAHRAERVTPGSVFATTDEASAFFRCSPTGYAATRRADVFDGVALSTDTWAVAPLELEDVRSSFFDDPRRFPAGTAVPDSAFVMAEIATTWRPLPAVTGASRNLPASPVPAR